MPELCYRKELSRNISSSMYMRATCLLMWTLYSWDTKELKEYGTKIVLVSWFDSLSNDARECLRKWWISCYNSIFFVELSVKIWDSMNFFRWSRWGWNELDMCLLALFDWTTNMLRTKLFFGSMWNWVFKHLLSNKLVSQSCSETWQVFQAKDLRIMPFTRRGLDLDNACAQYLERSFPK